MNGARHGPQADEGPHANGPRRLDPREREEQQERRGRVGEVLGRRDGPVDGDVLLHQMHVANAGANVDETRRVAPGEEPVVMRDRQHDDHREGDQDQCPEEIAPASFHTAPS